MSETEHTPAQAHPAPGGGLSPMATALLHDELVADFNILAQLRAIRAVLREMHGAEPLTPELRASLPSNAELRRFLQLRGGDEYAGQ